jgi:hypothetical protein
MSERVIRNVAVGAAGRFDNWLLDEDTGRLLMADLKTKRKAHWTWMEVDAQLSVYARAEWMLEAFQDADGVWRVRYAPGPMHHVDQHEGVVLMMPSSGAPAYLRRADLDYGWDVALHARKTVQQRAFGKSAARMADMHWPMPLSEMFKLPTS